MSVKLGELEIREHEGKIVVGKVNKRGHLTDYIDVSTPVINKVIKALTTQRIDKNGEGGTFICQKVSDPETNEERYYSITCVEMTPEEVSNMKENQKRSAANVRKSMAGLMGIMMNNLTGSLFG